MAKLKSEKGAIYAVSEINLADGAVNAIFRRKAINPNGDLGEVIMKHCSPGWEMVLTYPQAVSLANEILKRCQ